MVSSTLVLVVTQEVQVYHWRSDACSAMCSPSYLIELSGNSRRIFPGNLIMFTSKNGYHNKPFSV